MSALGNHALLDNPMPDWISAINLLTGVSANRIRELATAEASGRILIPPCKIGDVVRDEIADYTFHVEKIEAFPYKGDEGKTHFLMRCGNPGTDDYMAFWDFEVGEKITILGDKDDQARSELCE